MIDKPCNTISHAMVLAAGFGKRMRPLTDTQPKPLVKLAGKALLDHVLDRLDQAGIENAVVNMHYLGNQIATHLETRHAPQITISDERDTVLDTGGGVKKALSYLGSDPFIVHNSDSVWTEGAVHNLQLLCKAWQPDQMDALLLLAHRDCSLGYAGRGDFQIGFDNQIRRSNPNEQVPYIFAGVSILKRQLFDDMTADAFSLNVVFDRAILSKKLYGYVLDGLWMHVGTPEALIEAEIAMQNNLCQTSD